MQLETSFYYKYQGQKTMFIHINHEEIETTHGHNGVSSIDELFPTRCMVSPSDVEGTRVCLLLRGWSLQVLGIPMGNTESLVLWPVGIPTIFHTCH